MPIPSHRPEINDTRPPEPVKTPYVQPRPGAVFQRVVGHQKKYALVRGVIVQGDGSWGAVLDPGFSDCIRITSSDGWTRESDWHPVPENQPVLVSDLESLVASMVEEQIGRIGAPRTNIAAAVEPVFGLPVVDAPVEPAPAGRRGRRTVEPART